MYLLYGKRTGLLVNGEPVYDKQFRALDYGGVRVSKLSDAGTYAERSDAEEVLAKRCQPYIDDGLAVFEIRKVK